MRPLLATLWNLTRKRRIDEDLDAELRSYIALLADEREGSGMSRPEAERSARIESGGIEQVKEQVRDARGGAWVESLLQDIRFALRTLGKNKAFALAAMLSVAIGVGANTGIFTLVNSLFLQPLPVRDPARLVVVYGDDGEASEGETRLSRMNFADWQTRAHSFEALAAVSADLPVSLVTDSMTAAAFTEFVSASYFEVAGIKPGRGRFFRNEEDRVAGDSPVAVISDGCWKRRFAGDPAVIGRTIRLNGYPVTIIGVGPPGFQGFSTFFGPELWIPSMLSGQILGDEGRAWLNQRETPAFNIYGRLRDGVARSQAEAEMRRVSRVLKGEHPKINQQLGARVRPVTEATIFPGLGKGGLAAGALLITVVGLVLLIACSNVANLMLARGATRRHEIAVRVSLGASRTRLVRQVLTESVLLGLMGGFAGVLLAEWVRQLLWAQRPALVANNLVEPQVDGTVLMYAAIISIAAGMLFGILPALEASQVRVSGSLRDEGPSVIGGRGLARHSRLLIGSQVALSLLCLIVAGVFLRTLEGLYGGDPGFETTRLALVSVSPAQAGLRLQQGQQYYQDLRRRLERIPGVAGVSWALNYPLFGGASRGVVAADSGRGNEAPQSALFNVVDVDYFRTVGLALLHGRAFATSDNASGRPVAVVNEAFARIYWSGRDAIGRRLRLTGENFEREVVGVSKTAKMVFLGEPPTACVYVPLAQTAQPGMVLYIRAGSANSAAAVLGATLRVVRDVDARIMPLDATTIGTLMDNNLWIARVMVGLLALLGLLGLMLASIGVYGVMAFYVNTRQREFGLRMALGATAASVVRLVLQQGFAVAGWGLAAGLVFGLGVCEFLTKLVPGVLRFDALGVAGASAALLAAALLACYLPARRASATEPLDALREA